jgi:hypothetical protein
MLVPSMKLPRPIFALLVLSICGLFVEIIVALLTRAYFGFSERRPG